MIRDRRSRVARRQSLDQALAGAGGRLQVGDVQRAGAGEGGGVRDHPLDDEGMQAVRGPGVGAAQRLHDDQALTQSSRLLDRVLDRSHLMPPGAVESVMKGMKPAGDFEHER